MAKRPEMRSGSVPSLAALAANGGKGTSFEAPAAPKGVPDLVEDGPGLTLYTKRHTYEALKRLALDERTTVHALLVEGVQKVFESRNLQAVAQAGHRPGSKNRTTSAS